MDVYKKSFSFFEQKMNLMSDLFLDLFQLLRMCLPLMNEKKKVKPCDSLEMAKSKLNCVYYYWRQGLYDVLKTCKVMCKGMCKDLLMKTWGSWLPPIHLPFLAVGV